MKRSALALGASVLALALTAGPAAAEPGVGQTVDDSTATAQIGAVSVDAPVRALSDGDDTEAAAGSTGGTQSTGDSTGSAQVGAVDVGAPVRVASDGDNSADASSGTSASDQSIDHSSGSAQVGSPNVAAPVRVLSDGDDTTGDADDTGPQTVGDSSGSAQVGSPSLFAPVRVLSGGTGPGDDSDPADAGDIPEEILADLLGHPSGSRDVVATPSAVAPTTGGGRGSPSAEELRRLLDGSDPDPAIAFSPYGTGGTSTSQIATLGVAAAGTLPLTGFGLVAVALFGLWLFAGGLGLRRVPEGKRR